MRFLERKWEGKSYRLYVKRDKDSLWVHFQGQTWLWQSKKPLQKNREKIKKKQELIIAALPGKIQRVYVKKGDQVKEGQDLVILSSMKIEYTFRAEGEARVEEVFCEKGQTVNSGEKLIKVKYTDPV